MNKHQQFLFFMIFVSIITGCHQPIKNPHLSDPIYLYYQSELGDLEKLISASEGVIQKSSLSLSTLESGSNQRQNLLESIFDEQKKLTKFQEKKRFLATKLSERRKLDQISYNKAFLDKKPWPDPEEWKIFELKTNLEKKKGVVWTAEDRINELHPPKKQSRAPAAEGHGEAHE